MAVISFYDTSKLDSQQLSNALESTDHQWEFITDKISTANINPEAEIISVFVSSTVTREMLEQMPKLTLICCRSTGYNNVDLKAAAERNITVTNVPTYGEETVAEYVFTLLLALTRNLPEVLETEFEEFHPRELRGIDLAGRTLGVIGTGHIGQKTLKIANGFSLRTLAYDLFPNEEAAQELGFTYVGLDELLRESDFVSLHLPYNTETHHLLNTERLQAMKRGAILINTARGALVDTGALIKVLKDGHLAGAGLDVIEGELLLNLEEEMALLARGETNADTLRHSVEISALKKMPNVIVSPHNAYNTVGAIGRINGTTVQNIIDFYNHHVPNQVTAKPVATGKLVLLRHTESVWNACGVWSGVTDIPLSEKGRYDCTPVGHAIKDIGFPIDVAFHTEQVRTRKTLEGILDTLGEHQTEVLLESGFNERNYGEYTGMDKWKVKETLGEERFNEIRRGWDVPFPNGETLKQVYERVVPAYQERVLPLLREGKNVMVVAHGNSLRALMKHLESISDEDIPQVEMLMNEMVIYDIQPENGLMESVERRETGISIDSHF
jgi:D-lactate dehydrogenase